MVKMNFTNSQTAFEYALYMIAASYLISLLVCQKLQRKTCFCSTKNKN